jgi:hypothetical protein
MLYPARGDQGRDRSGGGRQGRPDMSADSRAQTAGPRRYASPALSHRRKDGDERAAQVGGPQYWRLPIDLDLLY